MTEALQAVPTSGGMTAAGVFADLKDLVKFGVAAKYAPASLSQPAATPATPATPSGQPNTGSAIAEALGPVAAVYAADAANKRLNKNPPYWMAGAFALVVLVPLGLYLYRPKRG